MNDITQNSTASENEIKINMTFEEALEITQETYNNYQENADNDLNNLDIQKFQNIQNPKGNFKLYHKFHDKNSNFSGMTYIYEEENAVNVAIACRGSLSIWNPTGLWKDWICNNSIMLCMYRTKSDEFAEKYAYHILENICQQYTDKEIHVITLGHSKGGREAQIQMLKIHNKFENKNKIKKVSCFTFNSAPICICDSNKGEHNQYCQNIIVSDSGFFLKDVLAIFPKYGTEVSYSLYNKDFALLRFLYYSIIALSSLLIVNKFSLWDISHIFLPICAILIQLIALYFEKTTVIIIFSIIVFLLSLENWLGYSLFIIVILFTVNGFHGLKEISENSSYFNTLKNINISEFFYLKNKELYKFVCEEYFKQHKNTKDKIEEYLQKEYNKSDINCSEYLLLDIASSYTEGKIIYEDEFDVIQSVKAFDCLKNKGFKSSLFVKVYKKEFFKDKQQLSYVMETGDEMVIIHSFNKKNNKIEYKIRYPYF